MISNAARRNTGLRSGPSAIATGSIVILSLGEVAGLPYYAVSTHLPRRVELRCPVSLDVAFFYAAYNSGLLLLPDHALAAFFRPKRGFHSLEVVQVTTSAHGAIQLGMLRRQRTICDLQIGREIPLIPAIELGDGLQ